MHDLARSKKLLMWLVVVGLILIALRIALPPTIKWYINDTLNKAEDYTGSVGNVGLSLWRGAYQIDNVVLKKKEGDIEHPFFEVKHLEFSLLWSALIDGAVVGTVLLEQPTINFVDAEKEEDKQTGTSENWLMLAQQLFPLRIDKLQINQGKIQFHNEDAKPEIHAALTDVNATLLNLVNSREVAKELNASLNATGKTQETGTLTIEASLNPNTPKPTFDVNMVVESVALSNFENIFNHYAPFDLEAGILDMAIELASDDGELLGYIKPVLKDVEVFTWKGDVIEDKDGLLSILAEMFSGGIAELLENQSEDQIATKIPLSGSFDELEVGSWQAFIGVLRNAFVEAIKAKLENSVSFKSLISDDEKPEDDNPNKTKSDKSKQPENKHNEQQTEQQP
ncbi:DUF748 domain-containing protein [Flocculibacter collagenilyticus]|uniref:DUF748 domain-containing protein n=1 Tax=Flocculibacter collagenilyticus TaxID=2744479 RepID=UPI0018F6F0D9|nr:DUF748 domain-containing protein [Flocculibacter collagenilyticus]